MGDTYGRVAVSECEVREDIRFGNQKGFYYAAV